MEPQSNDGPALTEEAQRVLPLIDLTSLGDQDTVAMIDLLCDQSSTNYGSVAAVCVWPRFVAQAAARLAGTPIGIAAVANFPEGDPDVDRAAADAAEIVAAGGTEVDVVYPWRSLAAGDTAIGVQVVAATRAVVGPEIVLKVILESGELKDNNLIRQAATDSMEAGADFLKTSTGKTANSATLEAAKTLLEVIANANVGTGLKISGGVRTVAEATSYLELADEIMGSEWATPKTFRFGASSLLADVLGASGEHPAGSY